VQSFWVKSLIIFGLSLFLGGCQRDVNLAADVDLLTKTASPTPFIPQNPLQNRTQPRQQMPPQIPSQTPTVTAAPVTDEEATVSAVPAEMYAQIVTSAGKIKIKLLPKEAPNTVKNFVTKVRSGFYAGLNFHRVENWVIQGGDPQGTGRGGGTMPTELSQMPFKTGSVGVARGGDIAVSNDSQFFICTSDCSWLTGQYTLFGEVVEGMDVAKQVTVGMQIDEIVELAN
jgi:cyclophilin family peptidyl-prolyl cis-trans isomerase